MGKAKAMHILINWFVTTVAILIAAYLLHGNTIAPKGPLHKQPALLSARPASWVLWMRGHASRCLSS